ncbi:MAG TPA: hypothetical protein GXZ76_05395 [Clostridiaceae bacterium]|nr:hypothetical protein [Clostridiaceae bacterium]
MKQKNSAALVVIRGMISFVLVFILLCSVSCEKGDSAKFSKNTQSEHSERASKTWKKVVFTESEQGSDKNSETLSRSDSSGANTEESTTATAQTTTKTTDETTATTAPTTTTAPPTTASTTIDLGKYTADQLVGEWESYLTVDYYSEKSESGVMDNIWSEEIVFATTLTHISGNKFTISLTPVRYILDYEEADMNGMRPGPLNYEAEVNKDVLSFSLESETFAFEEFYDKGFIKPLDIKLELDKGEYLFGLVYVTEEAKIDGLPSMARVSFYITKYIST